ncbi:YybH family protein [Phytoactinopolyspora endophytica]|uniref:YybH family protein n=1 Tax=Phytoactinopolyspora endophytica TaxID=1642495 RepID=UPI00101B7E10|nr:nuclear transport factor 2 family protein [Phytoactinopolyspora endophytica]
MATQHATDEAAIRQQVDNLIDGIRARDLDGLKPLYATDIVSFDVQPPLQHVGAEAKMKNWVDVFTIYEEPHYEVHDLTITVDGDVAFAHSLNRLSGRLTNGTTASGFWVRFTACFRKLDGKWLIAHDHVSLPLDFESGKALMDLEP